VNHYYKLGARFSARFDSECARCGGDNEEGDDVGWIDDEVCCIECYNECSDANKATRPSNKWLDGFTE
jgi:hypothetical protein